MGGDRSTDVPLCAHQIFPMMFDAVTEFRYWLYDHGLNQIRKIRYVEAPTEKFLQLYEEIRMVNDPPWVDAQYGGLLVKGVPVVPSDVKDFTASFA